jgi:predicted nucleic acid-binding protein
MITLLDNTVMSNFSAIQRPDLLQRLFGKKVATTEQAFTELQIGIQIGKLPSCDWSWLSVITLTTEELLLYNQLLNTLNAGEAACIAVAAKRGYRVLTDDRDARELSQQMRIPISGTLGILLLVVEQDLLPLAQTDSLLKQLIISGYRSPVTSLTELH